MNNHSMSPRRCARGFVLLSATIVVAAVSLAAAVSAIALGAGSARTSGAAASSASSRALADACTEIALGRLWEDASFLGTGSATVGSGTCDYEVVSFGGDVREVTGTGTMGTFVRRVRATTNALSPLIELSDWSEIP